MADQNDLELLIKLRFDYFAAEDQIFTPEEKASLTANLTSYIQRHINIDFYAAFAEVDGQIASTAYLATSEKPANTTWPTGKIGTILNVLTYPEHRKKGYATACLNALIDLAKRENLSYLELSASEMGQPVYEKLGFKVPTPSHFTPMRLSLL